MNTGDSVIILDTEWGYRNGRIGSESALVPVVLCAKVLHSGQELVFLPGKDDQLLREFLAENNNALWVAHSITAEMKYLLRLGMPNPERWYDTLLAERWLTNSPLRLEAGLVKALERHGLSWLAPLEKKDIRQKILTLNFSSDDDRGMDEIVEYCMQDCRACAALFLRQRHDPEDCLQLDKWMPWWSLYKMPVAKMELRGIPVDVQKYRQIIDSWPEIRESLAGEINEIAPVMALSGIKRQAFQRFCTLIQIPQPRVYDKKARRMRFSIASEALKEIEHYHPLIPIIRQTHKTLIAFRNNKIVVDLGTGRHYFDVIPFGTITGRNSPGQLIFGQAKWMRFLIVPESPEHVLFYVDYSAQEVGIAAALSRDPAMGAMYEAEDPHMAFAELAGAVPAGARKDEYPEIRKKYKTVNLGVLYGLTPAGTARKLGITEKEARELHQIHRRLFPVFWDWSERTVVTAMNRGMIKTRLGWRCLVPPESNERTWANWPMQAAGADIMRLTVMYLDREGADLLAPVHDGFLLSCHRQDLHKLHGIVDFSCGAAVEHALGDFKLRWTTTVYEERFEDPDGLPLWETVQRLIREPRHEREG